MEGLSHPQAASWRTVPIPPSPPQQGSGAVLALGNQSRGGHLDLSASSDPFFLYFRIGAERCLSSVPPGALKESCRFNGEPSQAWEGRGSCLQLLPAHSPQRNLKSWDKMGYTCQAPNHPCSLPNADWAWLNPPPRPTPGSPFLPTHTPNSWQALNISRGDLFLWG